MISEINLGVSLSSTLTSAAAFGVLFHYQRFIVTAMQLSDCDLTDIG